MLGIESVGSKNFKFWRENIAFVDFSFIYLFRFSSLVDVKTRWDGCMDGREADLELDRGTLSSQFRIPSSLQHLDQRQVSSQTHSLLVLKISAIVDAAQK